LIVFDFLNRNQILKTARKWYSSF